MSARLAAAALVCLTLTAVAPASSAAAAPPSGWTLPWNLDSNGFAYEVQVAPLPGGGAVAVWMRNTGIDTPLEYSEYVPGSGWQAPVQMNFPGVNAFGFSLAVNDAGYGVAAWMEFAGAARAQASFFHAGEGFSPAASIANNTTFTQSLPQAAIDSAGGATVLFAEHDGAVTSEFAVRGDAVARTWSAAALLENDDTGDVFGGVGAVVASGVGEAHAFWYQSKATGDHYYRSAFTQAAGWSAPVQLDAMAAPGPQAIAAAAFSDGRVVAAWTEPNATGEASIGYRAYAPSLGWAAAPGALATAGTVISAPHIACGGQSACLIEWTETSAGPRREAYALSSDAGISFAAPQDLDPSMLGDARAGAVAINAAGDGAVVWTQQAEAPTGGKVYAQVSGRLFSEAFGLRPAQRLDRVSSQSSALVSVQVCASGEVAVGWSMEQGTGNAVYASLYAPADVSPPKLRVTAPLAGASLTEPSVVVTGTTDPDATLVVNGLLAQVRPDGSFVLRIPLVVGNNTVRVIALDPSGNNESVTIAVAVFDSTADLAAQLAGANLTMIWLSENITTLEEEQNTTITNFLILQNNLASLNASWTQMRDELSTAKNESSSALASGNAALATVNETRAQAAAAQSAAGTASTVGLIGLLAGIAGVALAAIAVRRGGQAGSPKTSFAQRGGEGQGGALYNPASMKGGEGQGGGLYNPPAAMDISRQTPKRDFGDRMKAGMDTAGGIAPEEPGSLDLSAESESEEEEEEDEERSASKDHATGLATGKRTAAPRDAASGQATGKRGAEEQPEALFNPKEYTRGPRQSTSVDGSFNEPRTAADAKYGSVAGAHRDESIADISARSSAAPRDAASGQASGKRSSMAGEYARDAATGQASGFQAEAPTGTHHEVKAPRDAASGQATGRRAPDSPGGDAAPGMAINEQGVAEPPPKKKPTK